MKDNFITWTNTREIFLGAHLMNDPNFKVISNDKKICDTDESKIEPNCFVRPSLEIVIARDIKIDKELLISYNYNSK